MQNLTTSRTMTSREIAELAGKLHKNVLRDIDSLLETLGSDLSQGFKSSTYLDSNGIERRQFIMDRDSTVCLVTGYDANSRMRVIKRWQELEAKALQPSLPDFTNPAEAARAWASEYEAKQLALEKLEAAQPAIEFHKRVGVAEDVHSIDEAAKIFRVKPHAFRRWLKLTINLFRLDGIPRQDFIDRGYVRVIEKTIQLPHGFKLYAQTFITGKGMQFFQRKLDHTLMDVAV